MKYAFATFVIIFPLLVGSACDKDSPLTVNENSQDNIGENDHSMNDTIRIAVGDKIFVAALLDNPTAKAFKGMLPLTISMTELNGNEKYFRFSNSMPVNALNPGTIHSGDLMLWGSDTLVLFYETFSTSYSYTKLGRINNPTGLAAALSAGNVTVTFELQ